MTSRLFRDKEAEQRDIQAFIYQRFKLLDDRVILSAGVAGFYGVLERVDNSNLPPPLGRRTRNAVTDYNLGAIIKPRPEVSLFAGYNRVGGALPIATSAGEYPTGSFKVGVGDQREFGVKTSWLKDRVTGSAVYFELVQHQVQSFNGSSIENPQLPRYVFHDVSSSGWELEVNALVTSSIELVGNITRMHMRDSNGVPRSGIPDHAAAVFAKHTFRAGRLKGWGVSLGLDYLSRRPGSSPDGSDIRTTPAGVPIQPSFYVAPRTILQAGVNYRSKHWHLTVVVHNLANKDYIRSAATRFSMEPGEPRNFSATLERRW